MWQLLSGDSKMDSDRGSKIASRIYTHFFSVPFISRIPFSTPWISYIYESPSQYISIYPLLVSLFYYFSYDPHLGHLHGVGQHLLQSTDWERLLQNEGTYGQVWGHILQMHKQ